MNPDTRAALELILDSLTAFGTLAAVWVAIYLARSERREVVRGRAALRIIVAQGERIRDGDECLVLSVTNLTHRPITVAGIGWRIGYIRPQLFFQMPASNPLTWKLPSKLEYGDTASFTFDAKSFFSDISAMADYIPLWWPWLSKRYIKFSVSTSGTSGGFFFTVDEEVAARFLLEARKIRKNRK